ncbi:MAG TPA: ribonuclease III family protein [Candidatus Bathyarchaeia archaeon]|nr:ribonuclease III family protein [Candidatus Bathyarchaeia archaeon]
MNDADSIRQIMQDKRLASLGDAYVNFVFSLALTKIKGNPAGVKVSDRILADAFKLAELRNFLGTRINRKDLANAAEALLFEVYQRGLISLDESVQLIVQNGEGPAYGLPNLLRVAIERLADRD